MMIDYKVYDIETDVVKEVVENEKHIITESKIHLKHIPQRNSVIIPGYSRTDKEPLEGEFYIDYGLNNGLIEFNSLENGKEVFVAYNAVGTVIWAEDKETDGIIGLNSVFQEIRDIREDLSEHTQDKENPHNVDKEQVGLGNVANVLQASKEDFDAHVQNENNPHKVTKVQIGLGNVENKSSATIRSEITSDNVTNALGFTPEDAAKKGQPSGYASLDANAKIPLAQLPDVAKQKTYIVEDPTEREALTDLVSGDKCFETSTGDSYIWDGDSWLLMADADWENVNLDWNNIVNKPSSSVSDIDEAVSKRHSHNNKAALDNITQTDIDNWNDHLSDKENPHGVDKEQVGLGNVINEKQATKTEFDDHTNATSVHGATSSATANRIIIRDSGGRAKVAAPIDSDDIARKEEVDAALSGAKDYVDNHVQLPTTAEKAALAGTSGAPSSTNKYVTDSDPRMTDARTPKAHKSTHAAGGSDALTPADIGAAPTNHSHSADDVTTGVLPVARGGTGIASYTSGNYIRASSATTLQQRTPAQVLSDIGAAAANHTHNELPTSSQKAALAGTVGTPSDTNRYVTDLDARLSDSRPPTAHNHNASDINAGILAVARGGTGIGSYTSGNYIRASGTSTLQQRTPAQVLADIGAAPLVHNHDAGNINSGTLHLDRVPIIPHTKTNFANQELNTTSNPQFAKIGINNSNPEAKLTIASSSVTENQIRLRSHRAAIVTNNIIGGIEMASNDTNLTAPGTVVSSIQAIAEATHSASQLRTGLSFSITNGTSFTEGMRLSGSGDLSFIGTLTGGTVPWARISGVPSATTSAAGIVRLENVYTSTATNRAPTSNALKLVADQVAGVAVTDHNLDLSNPTNGYYVKYGNGLMIAFHVQNLGSISFTNAFGSLFTSTSDFYWTFPAAFVDVPSVSGFPKSSVLSMWITNGETKNTYMRYYCVRNSTGTDSVEMTLMAIGRWK